MALVMLCGIPASGKSTRALEIADLFHSRIDGSDIREVHVINDSMLDIEKADYYDRETEKRARGKQMSTVKRLLGPHSIVILDCMSYIKGFRYQLYCEAKAAQVTSCVVYLGTPVDRAQAFNDSIESPWPKDLFDALAFRFEEPNGMTRWDSPLFVVVPEDKLPAEELWDALINRQPPKPNAATSKLAAVGTDFLTLLNSVTSQIVKEALDLHKRAPGSRTSLHGHPVQLPYNLTMPQLSRIRRNFISVNKQTPMPEERIVTYFIEFLQQNWDIVS